MDLPVLLVGLEGAEPRIPGMTFVRVPPAGLYGAALEGYRILVLGDAALERWRPAEVRRLLRHRVMIAGATRIGVALARRMGGSGSRVTLIEPDADLARRAADSLGDTL